MKRVLRLVESIVVMLGTTFANAQSFQETSIAFRKFDAKTRAGVTHSKYAEALSDIEFATSEYESVAGELNKANAELFRASLDKYKAAGAAWGLYIEFVVGNGDTITWRRFFLDKVVPQFCPGAGANILDTLDPCLSKNWVDARELSARVREVREPPAREKRPKK